MCRERSWGQRFRATSRSTHRRNSSMCQSREWWSLCWPISESSSSSTCPSPLAPKFLASASFLAGVSEKGEKGLCEGLAEKKSPLASGVASPRRRTAGEDNSRSLDASSRRRLLSTELWGLSIAVMAAEG